MQKIYFLLITIIAFNLKTNAQCSGCTTNITGLDAAPHIVTAGQVFCIAPTGTVTGQITVSVGGTLCNQGTINSFNLWIAGGTLINYGSLTTHNLLVSTAGTYTNYATTIIDSLLVENPSSTYINNGSQTNDAFGIADNGTVVNNGTISTHLMADSIGTFTNNGTINTGYDPIEYAKRAEDAGAGELLVNDISLDGTYKGYNVDMIAQIAKAVDIPVIACGGAGSIADFASAVEAGASAVAAGSMFVFQRPHQAVLISYPHQKDLTQQLFSKI